MNKSKSSSIAIVILGVLLAAALATTVVLAAFTQTKTASTTIKFANGVDVQILVNSGKITTDGANGETVNFLANNLTDQIAGGTFISGVTAKLVEGSANANLAFNFSVALNADLTAAGANTAGYVISAARVGETQVVNWTIAHDSDGTEGATAAVNKATVAVTFPAGVTIGTLDGNTLPLTMAANLPASGAEAAAIITSVAITGATGDNDLAGIAVDVSATFTATAVAAS